MPLVAVGEELQARKQPFFYVGGKNSREEKIVKELGWEFIGIDSGKWRRDNSLTGVLANVSDLLAVAKGFLESVKILNKTGAGVVFSKGGHVALPMVLAARFKKRRLVIHESDVVMGVTNRFSTRFASKIFTAYSPSVFTANDNRYEQVGIPLRKNLRQAASLKAPAKSRPVLMVMGGIQGAATINTYIRQLMPILVKKYDIIHSVGDQGVAAMKDAWQSLPKAEQAHYKPYASIDRELPYYYQTADLVISRASATVIAEAALFSKAVYLIPLPNGAGDHQVVNAKILQKAGAAIYKEQYQLTPELLLNDINNLMADDDKRKELGAKLHDYFDNSKTLERIMGSLND